MAWLDWLNFLTRWAHLIFGISWIGSSFYFMWLDSHLEEPSHANGVRSSEARDVEGVLWMTHSGGFYQVLRKKIAPGGMPKTLHWFKYEALFTWVSGVFMLGLVYYLNQGAYLIDPNVMKLSPLQATGISVALLVATWFIYDALWLTVGKKHPTVTTGICIALICVLAYFLCHVFSGRGAFIHMGAIFGTIMVANVWVRILPAQQRMIDATKKGKSPDFAHSGYAKRRSVHNSYMTFPVLFMMLSNHYAMTYAHHQSSVILFLLVAFGISFRHVMIARDTIGKRIALVPTSISLAMLIGMTSQPAASQVRKDSGGPRVRYAEVNTVMQNRCLSCHSAKPTDTTFGPATGGVFFDSPEQIKRLVDRIKVRVIDTKTMPLVNKTGMTDEERNLLGRWIEQGASFDGASR